jgi:arylsulfatase A-like enzyme
MLGSPNDDKNMSHAQNVIHPEKLRELPDMDEMVVPADEVFLPQALQSVGYRTFLFGKWHLG